MKKYLVLSLIFLLALTTANAKNEGWINILDAGGNNKGILCTTAIQKAIDKASTNGGGTIFFPTGNYLTGALKLKSNITIYVDAGAVLKFSENFDDYLPYVEMRYEGIMMKTFSPLFYAKDAENITIKGRGVIDGQGKAWWNEVYRIETAKGPIPQTKYQTLWEEQNKGIKYEAYYKRTIDKKFFRPSFFQVLNCKNILIEGVTFQNSPFWTINPEFCENITITGITINNPHSPNTDGINPSSCKNVHISNCHISVGDDCITIKSGRDEDGRKYNVATENVTITNCTMLSGHGGVVIGSEMSGGIKKITISNCVFDGTDRGIRLKSARGRGGVVEDIRIDNIVMKNIKEEAVILDLFYDKSSKEEPVSERTPIFRNIHISNLTGTEVKKAGTIYGISEMPVQNISFSNINIQSVEGFTLNTADNIEFHDAKITTTIGASFKIENSTNLILDNVATMKPVANTPLIKLTDVSNMMINNNFPMFATDVFLDADGAKTKGIYLKNNVFNNVKKVVNKGAALNAAAVVE
ncbi:glycoside hydrolase family 28 protein [Flavobacterium undicola]|uniref:glycoside hydrolase family 28 protein n=1 Tax=Flavobacterium undicola TaxID=1932779 RepID=UPI00137894BE|nr:glycoside hydrolase family 28 protein [Flavobacterium undicola]MBA0882133.1 glycoside hydrolase family 28 protein [Flavobacterium undicola]